MLEGMDWLRSLYYSIEIAGKDRSNRLYNEITDQSHHSDGSRPIDRAWHIPTTCFLEFYSKFITAMFRTADMAQQSLRDREIAYGNIQTLGVDLFEFTRTFAGMFLGIPVSYLRSPKLAAELFLTPNAGGQKPFLKPDEAAQLYAMGHKLDGFFKKHHLDYRICSGTALGAYREKGIIKNDDDIDLMLHPDSVEAFEALVKDGTFERETGLKLEFQKLSGGYECFFPDAPFGKKGTPTEKIGKPFVDIFPGFRRKLAGVEVITYKEDKMFYQSQGDHFTEEEWNKTPEHYPFGPIELMGVPKDDMESYLTRCYGPIALHYKTRIYPHEVYSQVYATPLRTPWILMEHRAPTFMRHQKADPLECDEDIYQLRTQAVNIYVDGIYDLFHDGHRNYIEKAIQAARNEHPGVRIHVVAGVCNEGVEQYKRQPILTHDERALSVERYLKHLCHNNPLVSYEVLRDAPLAVTPEVIKDKKINIVFHGDDFDTSKIDEYYGAVTDVCEFMTVPYTEGISTSDLLRDFKKHGTHAKFNNETVVSNAVIARRIQQKTWEQLFPAKEEALAENMLRMLSYRS